MDRTAGQRYGSDLIVDVMREYEIPHAALMPASGGPARLVTHLQMGSSLRHPILGTGGLGRRSSSLRPAPHPTITVH